MAGLDVLVTSKEPVARKGYSSRAAIPSELLARLNAGEEETRTLAEWLAIDPAVLARATLPAIGLSDCVGECCQLVEALRPKGLMTVHRGLGAVIRAALDRGDRAGRIFDRLASHRSDAVRGWAAFSLAADNGLSLPARLEAARRFARDPNMGVRELAWSSYRPFLAGHLDEVWGLLSGWVIDPDPNIRRCAVESTRPRGVWCSHLGELRKDPEPGRVLLEPCRSDEARYVQASVANWINDASKDHPEWAKDLCARWERESPTASTRWIVKRALRTVQGR